MVDALASGACVRKYVEVRSESLRSARETTLANWFCKDVATGSRNVTKSSIINT